MKRIKQIQIYTLFALGWILIGFTFYFIFLIFQALYNITVFVQSLIGVNISCVVWLALLVLVITLLWLVLPRVIQLYKELSSHRSQLLTESSSRQLEHAGIGLRLTELATTVEIERIRNETKQLELELAFRRLKAGDRESVIIEGQVFTAPLGYQKVAGELATNYAPRFNMTVSNVETKNLESPIMGIETVKSSKGLDLMDCLQYIGQKPGQIFMALGPDNEPIYADIYKMFHVALAAFTRGGKTNTLRVIVPQLISQNGVVCYIDPAWTGFDPESLEDFRMIEERLACPPAYTEEAISKIFRFFVAELDNRLDIRRRGQKAPYALFLVIDELPAVVKMCPQAPDDIGRLVREAAKVGIFVILSAQDFLTKTIASDGAMRENLRTVYYYGGDVTTARTLLDLQGKKDREIDDGNLGRGIGLLKSPGTPVVRVKVPYASNEGICEILGMKLLPPPEIVQQAPSKLDLNKYIDMGESGQLSSIEQEVYDLITERKSEGLPVGNNSLFKELEGIYTYSAISDAKKVLKDRGYI